MIKQLLHSVFVISGVIKVSEIVTSHGHNFPEITKTESLLFIIFNCSSASYRFFVSSFVVLLSFSNTSHFPPQAKSFKV